MGQGSSEARASDSRRVRDIARIEALLRDLHGESDTVTGLMREHLEAARFYLLGSMPHEYGHTLRLARDLSGDIEDKNLQSRVTDFLRSQDAYVEPSG